MNIVNYSLDPGQFTPCFFLYRGEISRRVVTTVFKKEKNAVMSSSVLSTPKETTRVPWASAWLSPSDSNTWDALSEPVAQAMAEGVLAASPAAIAIAVTGIAGPGGGTADKPVGLVHLAVARRGGRLVHEKQLFGDRSRREIRFLTVQRAFVLAGAVL